MAEPARGVTFDDVRRVALSLPGATEGTSFGTPAFHVAKKLFVRLKEDGETIVLKVSPYERPYLLDAEPEVFYITDHYRDWPAVLMRLGAATQERMALAVEESWRFAAKPKLIAELEARRASGG